MKRYVWGTLIAVAACAAFGSAAVAAAPSTGTDAAFKGKIGRTENDSSPDWPKAPRAAAGAPNIVLILLDDVGFGASSTFGGAVRTPVLDQLAAGGWAGCCFPGSGLPSFKHSSR